MSVWPSSVTRLDTARDVYESSSVLFNTAYGKKIYPHINPVGNHTPWDRQTTWQEVASDLNWEKPDDEEGTFLKADLVPLERVKVGSEAYFELVQAVHTKKFCPPQACNHDKIQLVLETMAKIVAPSTQIAPGKFAIESTKYDRRVMEKANHFYDAADELKILKRSRMWDDQEDEFVDSTKNRTSDVSMYKYRKVGKVHLFLGSGPYKTKALLLSNKGMDMAIGALERLSAAHEYVSRAWESKPVMVARFLDLIDYQIMRSSSLRGRTADSVAKAWHEVRTFVQYRVLASVLTDAEESIRVEYVTDGYADIVELDRAASLVTGTDDAMTMELVHVYKWIPPPEYDVTRAQPLIEILHSAPRKSGANPQASDQAKATYAEIVAERKMNLLIALKRMSGEYPQNLVKAKEHPTIAEAAAWDHRGALTYEQMGPHVSRQVKDKTTVKARIEAEIRSTGGDLDQNYLTWYLANWDRIDTKNMLDDFAAGRCTEDAYSRVAYKGESQKVDSRPFYMAPPIRRTLLAEHEGNLSKVARYYPAVLMGKTDAGSGAMMDTAMDPYSFNTSVPSNVVTTTYIVIFDVSKWSPKSDGEQVSEYHDFWAEVYDDKRLSKLSGIGCNDEILSTTDGVIIRYQNSGADLEGYRGRMGTMYHADLLGTVCRKAIRRGIIAGKSQLVVFIDDGAVKLEVVGEGEAAEGRVVEFIEVMKEVYAAGGQEIHNRKVVASKRGGEILANFYLDGVKIPQGIKAAMKMTPDYTNPVGSLVDANDSTFASAQGALKAGAHPIRMYMMYMSMVLKNYARFNRQAMTVMSPTTMALFAFSPKSFGGLGTQSLQGLVTTCVTNITVEGISILNRAGRFYPSLRPSIKKIITHPVLVREPLSILRDPTRLALAGPSMIESRLVRYVVERLLDREPMLRRLVAGASAQALVDHATNVAENLLQGGSISVPLLVRAWSATPLAQVETVIGKFERSDSIIGFIGYRTVGKIRRQNTRDVRNITQFFIDLLGNV